MSVTIASEPSSLRIDQAGTIRVGTTRVTLDTVVAAFTTGATPEQIVQDYPALDLADVYAAIGYYLRHQADLDQYLRIRHDAAEAFRRQNPRVYPQCIRERLLARRAADPGN